MDSREARFLLYRAANDEVSVNALILNDSIWLNQKAMAELFGVEGQTITYHLKEIYKTGELVEEATARKIRVVQKEGLRSVEREILFYNLDAIISVGYRVNSRRATQFRIWATGVLREYMLTVSGVSRRLGTPKFRIVPSGKRAALSLSAAR